MADDETSGLVLKLIICLIAAASATVVVTIYHCITAKCARPSRRPPPTVQQEMSMDNSVAELLPAHKYDKDVGLMGLDDGMCAICLCEFEDGEELRTLPECFHSFHVACIDMWLYSHSNCPMCRTFVGEQGIPSPSLMHLLNPSNVVVVHNVTPMENTIL